MIWVIDQFGQGYYGTDIYGQYIWTYQNTPVQVFYEERRYRYSGTLYSKLNSLLNILCFDRYITYNEITYGLLGDNCFFATFRYDSCEFIFQRTSYLWEQPTPIISGEYYNKLYYHPNAHFVDN